MTSLILTPDTLTNGLRHITVTHGQPIYKKPYTQKIISDNITEEIARLKQTTGDYIMIPGSATLIESLMETDLIDEYRFLVHPIIMGEGKRFFTDGMATTKLELVPLLPIGLGGNQYMPLLLNVRLGIPGR